MAKPLFVEEGIIRFASPDKGLFKIERGEKNGKMGADRGRAGRAWLCDGKAVSNIGRPKTGGGASVATGTAGQSNRPDPAAVPFRRRGQRPEAAVLHPHHHAVGRAGPDLARGLSRGQQDAANFHHANS